MKPVHLVLCGLLAVTFPSASILHVAVADHGWWGEQCRKLPPWWVGTGQTVRERVFFAMMDVRFGVQWMHTMQEEVGMSLWRQWCREWHRRDQKGS
ncbi:MAG: hypothetical protein RJA05_157 [Planctomycetota bacterium]|jgi:hypothetical protein